GGRAVCEDARGVRDPASPPTIPAKGAITPVKGGHTPIPLAEAAPLRFRARLAELLPPPSALADAGDDPFAAQHDFLAGLAPSTILRGLAAAQKLEAHARD